MMHWIIQGNMCSEKDLLCIAGALIENKVTFSVVKVVPFTKSVIPDITVPIIVDKPTKVIVWGTTAMCDVAVAKRWYPGSFLNSNFSFRVQNAIWNEHMLNNDSTIHAINKVPEQAEPFFIRPVLDTKSFIGQVMHWGEFSSWRDDLSRLELANLDLNTEVVVATEKLIQNEWRFWVIGGKVIAWSSYKFNGYKDTSKLVKDDMIEFVETITTVWSPSLIFVLDVAVTKFGYKIVEAGNFNSAGFYNANISNIIKAIEETFGN